MSRAVEHWQAAAAMGDGEAMHNLAVSYQTEGGSEDKNATALAWFQKAAAAGVVEAMFSLGVLYDGLENRKEAMKWYRAAAEGGVGDAQANLGGDNTIDTSDGWMD